jgi:hypothetical protein
MGTGQMSSGQGMGTGSMTARGGTILAATLLFVLGVYHFFAGIAGLARDNFYVVGQNYVYQLSSTGWGWLHVIGGVLLAITGLALFSRSATWARPVAVVLLAASLIANFFFLAYFPLWAALMIAIAIFCIWSIAREGSENREQRQAMGERMASAYGAQQAGTGAYVSTGAGAAYSGQGGQRWPENVGARDESAGRHWAPSDVKESERRPSDKAQEQAQTGARGASQAGRNAAEEAADRSRQGAGRDYRSGR